MSLGQPARHPQTVQSTKRRRIVLIGVVLQGSLLDNP